MYFDTHTPIYLYLMLLENYFKCPRLLNANEVNQVNIEHLAWICFDETWSSDKFSEWTT